MSFHTPPTVAAILTVALMIFLFRREIRERPNVTGAVWLPVLWIVIVCSRPVTWWLSLFGLPMGGFASEAAALEEGSPVDGCFFFALIAAGMYVLAKRQVNLGELVSNNPWLCAFLAYCFLAVFWSDFPFVAFRRWIKILGLPTMALVVITEPDFQAAVITVFKRCAYVLLPVSVLFIKYYPDLSRTYDDWTGAVMIQGIAVGKNSLGLDCLILGLLLFWYFLQLRRAEKTRARRRELFLVIGLFAANWWVLSKAQSSTSLACLLLGMLIMLLLGVKLVRDSATFYVVTGVCVIAVAEQVFGVSGYVLSFLHRNPTLTDRTLIWSELLKMKTNPIFGVGFESFWMGQRLQTVWAKQRMFQHLNEAHNGYLETYLNLGVIGLCLLLACIIAAYRKARLELFRNVQFGRLCLGVLAAVIAHDWTEVSFRGPNALWLLFYIIAIEYPNFATYSSEDAGLAPGMLGSESELVYADGDVESAHLPRGITSANL
jgi:exopolysaccharide production protein ExoQ